MLAASQKKDHIWEWLLVGVVTMNEHTIDDEPERVVPAAIMDVSVALLEQRQSILLGWEVTEWAWWELVQQTRAQSGVPLDSQPL